jgi:hypothetical protein
MTLAADGFAAIVAKLKQRGSYRRRSFKTSSSTVESLLQKSLTQAELDAELQRWHAEGILTSKDSKMSYVFLEEGLLIRACARTVTRGLRHRFRPVVRGLRALWEVCSMPSSTLARACSCSAFWQQSPALRGSFPDLEGRDSCAALW